MSNLEPINKADLDLENKFVEKKPEKTNQENSPENQNLQEPILKKSETFSEHKEISKEKKDAVYSKILSQISSYKPADTHNLLGDAEIIAAEQAVEGKINGLVNLAKEKGVLYAVKVARKVEDNYVLDELHDRLAFVFYEALVKEGLIKEV